MKPPSLILASGSPRRRVLLAMIGVEVDVVAPNIDEASVAAGLEPVPAALAVAAAKVRAVGIKDRPVLAADTVVVCNQEMLGKPADRADAERMVRTQLGQEISVISGIAVGTPDGTVTTEHSLSVLQVDSLSDERLTAYLDTGAGDDKAGALAVQDAAKDFVHLTTGSRSNVYGLPLSETISLLREAGVTVSDPRISG